MRKYIITDYRDKTFKNMSGRQTYRTEDKTKKLCGCWNKRTLFGSKMVVECFMVLQTDGGK